MGAGAERARSADGRGLGVVVSALPPTRFDPRASLVLGIDPGWAHVGFALVERRGNGFCVRRARTLSFDKRHRPADRSRLIVETLTDMLTNVFGHAAAVDLIAIEDQRQSQIGQAKAGRFTSANSRVNEVVGMVTAVAQIRNVPLVELGPATWKKQIGAGGRADKATVSRVVTTWLGDLGKTSQHARDAAGIALAGMMRGRTGAQ